MKKELLENFYNKEISYEINQLFFSLDLFFEEIKDDLKNLFLNSFQKICKEMIEYQKINDKKVAYIGYTMLRTNLLEKNYIYAVYIFDENWYLREPVYSTYFDVSLYFQQLNTLWNKLGDARKKYLGISENYIENCVSQFFLSVHQYIIKMMKYALPDAIKLEEYKIIKKADKFFIYLGELYENAYIIYKEKKEKDELLLFETYLEDRKSCKFFHLKNSDFRCRFFKGIDFSYTDFQHSIMQEVDLSDSILMQTNFSECDLSYAKFVNADLNEAIFEKAILCYADFTSVFACSVLNREEKWIKPSAFPVNFDYADLKNATFFNAVLIGVDFTKANLENTIFKDSVIKQCYFTSGQIQSLNFMQTKQFDFIEV